MFEHARRLLSMRAVRVEMALTVTIATIYSGSCSDLQFVTTSIAIPFSIAVTFGVCVCPCYLYRLTTRLYICYNISIITIYQRVFGRMSTFTRVAPDIIWPDMAAGYEVGFDHRSMHLHHCVIGQEFIVLQIR